MVYLCVCDQPAQFRIRLNNLDFGYDVYGNHLNFRFYSITYEKIAYKNLGLNAL